MAIAAAMQPDPAASPADPDPHLSKDEEPQMSKRPTPALQQHAERVDAGAKGLQH